ncbi:MULTISPECIES: AAA family ATPase [unclassified Pseudomonas]|uniref:AAA family ATPase n=1 Tax=unclassified Pseudomonas TaxID=196821 RepID=UPI0030DB9F3D
MLDYLHMKNVGPAPELEVNWAPRINLITGDNGLGKSFLLDLAWWALTRTWANTPALPVNPGKSSIEYVVKGKSGVAQPVVSTYKREDSSWPLKQSRPTMPGIVVYVRIDGGFSVWDPARNYWRSDKDRPAAYHFSADAVWDGLDVNGQRVCEGLERDWVNWQNGRKPQFKALENALRDLSPATEPLCVGAPRRVYLGEGRERPTLTIGNQNVPVTLASAGVRRILGLAYFLVWAWYEHQAAAELLDKKPERRFVILFDEPETHLHPRWQRTLMPSLLQAIKTLRGSHGAAPPQLLVATHSPLVAASLEPVFDEEQDDQIQLSIQDHKVTLTQGHWAAQGDASSWLVSDTFGLEQARSLEAEKAIEAAEAFMRGEKQLPEGLKTRASIHRALQKLLPAHDEFWPRWLIESGLLKFNGEGNQ